MTNSPPPQASSVPAHPERTRARTLAAQVPWALIVGVGCSLLLLAVTELADWCEEAVWTRLPDAAGFDGDAWWWILGVLTVTGLSVGLVVRYAPGHGGPDPATEGLIGPPMPIGMTPSVLSALVLALAGGVSLGPENPITACNIALVCWWGARMGRGTTEGWLALAAAGTIGALFATPVAAALILSEMAGKPGQALWDRLFAPLTAATAGAITTYLAGQPVFSVDVPAYPGVTWSDMLSGTCVALAAALLMLVGVYAFPHAYRLFRSIGNPIAMLGAGGLVLGLLGVLGGPLSLFKGLHEMKEITSDLDDHSAANLLLLAVVKVLALVVAAASGFRGGRIFPALFIGAIAGECAHALFPSIPLAAAIVCGVLGAVLPVTRQAWMSIFMAAMTVPDLRLLPLLCLVSLPVWLLVTDRPQMLIGSAEAEKGPEGSGGPGGSGRSNGLRHDPGPGPEADNDGTGKD